LDYCVIFFFKKQKSISTDSKGVSVVICAKNEESNLKAFLPLIIHQNYDIFEVIVINDRSEDNSHIYLQNLEKEYKFFKYIFIQHTPKHINPKKYALLEGIKLAKYENILLTDADCYPASKNWITKMMEAKTKDKKIVLGISLYEKTGSFLNQFIQFETNFTAIQYITLALLGKPYMGVGRNLLYERSLFFEKRAFEGIEKLTGGDDDLVVGKIATAKNTAVCLEKEGFTYSIPKNTWKDFIQQKQRHLSIGNYYRWDIKILLGSLHFSNTFFWFIGIFFIFYINIYFLCLFLSKIIINTFILAQINKKKLQEINIFLLPLLDFLFVIYFLIVGLSILFKKKIEWKT
jgi:glycosyltransferase involved in cell wall biosynthesis